MGSTQAAIGSAQAPPVSEDAVSLLRDWLGDSAVSWRLGTFGAGAEFVRQADERAEFSENDDRLTVVTGRGGLSFDLKAGPCLWAIETPGRDGTTWNHSLALCLPAPQCGMDSCATFLEIGADESALRPQDQGATLFSLGLDAMQMDMCIRTKEPELVALFRTYKGLPGLQVYQQVMQTPAADGTHWIVRTRTARLEVYGTMPMGRPGPRGPATFLFPKLFRAKRTHAATEPIPNAYVPCGYAYPPQPLRDGSGQRQPLCGLTQQRFEAVERKFGVPELHALKQQVRDAIANAMRPDELAISNNKHARGAVRVALRRMVQSGEAQPTINDWLNHFDPPRGEPD